VSKTREALLQLRWEWLPIGVTLPALNYARLLLR